MSIATAVETGVVFTWLGMVLGISFLEAPLKFRAPGITIPLGVGIGRLVFRALNIVEGVFALTCVILLVSSYASTPPWRLACLFGAAVVLMIGAGVLRPRMDARVRRGEISDDGSGGQPRHLLHIGYVALECVKVLLLLAAGIGLLVAA